MAAPLDQVQEFMYGMFRTPEAPPQKGPLPARLSALPRDESPLPGGVWLRFQNFGKARYRGWSVQMQLDDSGNIYLVAHLGDATEEKVKRPSWSGRPSQKLDPPVIQELRRKAAAAAAGPPYVGHAGLDHAPVFVLTVRDGDRVRELIYEGYEDDLVRHLRRITHFAYANPLHPGRARPSGRRRAP